MELTGDRAVAIVRERGGRMGASTEVPFDPEAPDAAVAQLRASCGAVGGVHLSIGLAHLEVAPVTLPAVPRATARTIVGTNADRFFLGTGASAVAVDARGTLGFATSADSIARWVQTFEQWAPVRVIEPAPESTLRALVAAGTRDAHLSVTAGPGEQGVLDITDGQLARVRRVPVVRGAADLNGARPLAASAAGAVPLHAFAAWGATAADASDDGAMLLSPELVRRFARRRQWRGARAAGALLVAVGLLGWALASWRERTLRALEARVATLTPQATQPLASRDALARLAAERAALATRATVDPLAVLSALSDRLPVDAVLQRVQFDGALWQVTGTTRNTDGVVRRLAADARFATVRIAGPTTRFRDGRAMVESFTLAFTWQPGATGRPRGRGA
ncbi:MAG: PilN domain-containing protein [Gemmatimonadaceae bacterium]|nr:PilN domain-containing protein [Gemmatimonadaceae bacterium]